MIEDNGAPNAMNSQGTLSINLLFHASSFCFLKFLASNPDTILKQWQRDPNPGVRLGTRKPNGGGACFTHDNHV